jgi:hypothetical protein
MTPCRFLLKDFNNLQTFKNLIIYKDFENLCLIYKEIKDLFVIYTYIYPKHVTAFTCTIKLVYSV